MNTHNKLTPRRRHRDATVADLNAAVRYEPDTGHFYSRFSGNRVGYINDKSKGYVCISILGGHMRAHRAALAIASGEWPSQFVDHINGDVADNRLTNLRPCSPNENQWNRRHQANNTSGFTGVCWHKPSGTWVAKIRINGRFTHLGCFADPEVAAKAYATAAVLHRGEFVPTRIAEISACT
jgi:hypothetical protein